MQNAGFQSVGLDAIYVPWQVSPTDLSAAIAGMKALGVAGFNVTIPHKSAVVKYLDEISPEAEIAGAVNTVLNRNGKLVGYNTDGAGLILALERKLGFSAKGKRILLLGAGGAARGAVAALADSGVASISILNRTRARAEELCQEMRAVFKEVVFTLFDLEECSAGPSDCIDLVINATSDGMDGRDFSLISLAQFGNAVKVYDMVYAARITPLCSAAKALGLQADDGLSMLAAQGELAFQLWTGRCPEEGLFYSVLESLIRISKP